MKRVALIAAVVGVALALPAAAWAHAVLLRRCRSPARSLNAAPTQVALTYSERIEPRFAVISVTDAGGNQEIAGTPARAPDDENTIFVPLKQIPEGWYLVWWRVISADGHPVRGAFTFAVGPTPGRRRSSSSPHSERAATPSLVILRWIVLLSLMAAVGLFVMRMLIARRPRAPALDDRRVGGRGRPRPRLDPDLRGRRDRQIRAPLGLRPGESDPADVRLALRQGLSDPGALPAPLRLRGRRRDLARPAGAADTLDRGAPGTHRSAARGGRGRPRPRGHRPRRPDLAARSRHPGRLDPHRRRLGLDRRPDRRPRHHVHRLGACARPRRPALLDRRFLLGHRADRRGDRQLALPPADVRVAVGDVLREDGAGQDRGPRDRAAAGVAQLPAERAAPARGRAPSRSRPRAPPSCCTSS